MIVGNPCGVGGLGILLVALILADAALAQQRTLGASSTEIATSFRGQVGRRVTYVCPADATAMSKPRVWGTDVYTDDSWICMSAVHAGVIESGVAGVVTVVIGGSVESLKGSTRNGVTSSSYGPYGHSMTFDKSSEPPQIEWKTSAQGLSPNAVSSIVVSCPPRGDAPLAMIFGTDIYTADSPICVAAVHANAVTADSGGLVTVTSVADQRKFPGSDRNGISSKTYNQLWSGFRVAAAQAAIGPTPGLRAVSAAPPPAPTETPTANSECGAAFANPCVGALDPASIKISWAAHPEAGKYRIRRDGNLFAEVDAQSREFVDATLQPGASAAYAVEAIRVTGTVNLNGQPTATRARDADTTPQNTNAGTNAIVVDRVAVLETSGSRSATTPTLALPTNVAAQSIAGPKGRVRVTWAPVAGANGYLVYRDGNPLPVDSGAATTNSTIDRGVPLGSHRYQVEALFTSPKSGHTVNGEASPGVLADVVFPQPSAPFLSQQGGPADSADMDAHYRTRCNGNAEIDVSSCAQVEPILNANANFTENWLNDLSNPGGAGPNWPIAKFADVHVLGLGRRVNCAQRTQPSGPIVCWATSHGSIPALGSQINGPALARAAEEAVDIKSFNMIVAYPNGQMFFGTWENPSSRGMSAFDREFNFVKMGGVVRFGTALDSQNVKPVPHVCLSCHGGRYDPKSRMVLGASLLPLIPLQLEFSSPQARANQEEAIRQINEIVLSSSPAPAIAAQINALYDGAPHTPGKRANDSAVPAGWRFEPNIYRQIIEPYCASCHFSRQGTMSFATATNVKTLRGAVQNSTCRTYSMPHAEMQFRRFWTEGGELSLPGLLSTWLGFDKCGP